MKKQLLFILIACILSIIAYLGYQSYRTIAAKKVFTEQIKYLPKPAIFQWLGKSAVSNDKPTIVLFFSPDCEHCQYEAQAIFKQKDAFANINLWWVSVADSSAIKQFAKTYHLEELPNNYLARLPVEKVVQTFGSISVPHIFIYDGNEVLQKEFRGETKIETILKYANPPQ